MRKDNIPKGTEGPETDQYETGNSSNIFVGPAAEGDSLLHLQVILSADYPQKLEKSLNQVLPKDEK